MLEFSLFYELSRCCNIVLIYKYIDVIINESNEEMNTLPY